VKATITTESHEQTTIELYPLPEAWKWVTVADAGAKQKHAIVDGPFGSNLKLTDYVEGGPVPVLTTKNLEGNYDNVRYISEKKFQELKRSAVYPGDLLVAKIGSCGKMGIYPQGKPPAMIPANLLKVTLNSEYDLKYVYYYFNSPFFQKTLKTIVKATAQPAFGVSNFRTLPLPYAPPDQQKHIVAEIEKQFSRLDEAVANLKRVKAKLKRYKAAVLKAAVEGKLTEDWRKQHPDVESASELLKRILVERRAKWTGKGKYKEPCAAQTTNLSHLPESWTWGLTQQLGEIQLGRQRSPKNRSRNYPTKYLRAANITEAGLDLSDVLDMEFAPEERDRYRLQRDDVVLSEASGSPRQVGKPAVWRDELSECCFQNTVIRLRARNLRSDYLLTVFRHFYINGSSLESPAGSESTISGQTNFR
jgi:type I restriction enzyme S subunit